MWSVARWYVSSKKGPKRTKKIPVVRGNGRWIGSLRPASRPLLHVAPSLKVSERCATYFDGIRKTGPSMTRRIFLEVTTTNISLGELHARTGLRSGLDPRQDAPTKITSLGGSKHSRALTIKNPYAQLCRTKHSTIRQGTALRRRSCTNRPLVHPPNLQTSNARCATSQAADQRSSVERPSLPPSDDPQEGPWQGWTKLDRPNHRPASRRWRKEKIAHC